MAISKDAILGDPPAAKARWTLDKLLKGAGPDADPTEIDVPATRIVVRKTADETVNNSSTLQNDDHLILPLGANEVWIFQFFLFSNSSTTADIKIAFTAPTGAVFQYLISSADIGVDSSTTTATFARMSTGAINIYGESLDKLDILRGLVINGANAGNLQLQWAQSLAEVSDTIVRANSCLIATKIA